MMVLKDLKPHLVWTIFEDIIAQTPHCSGNERKLRENLKSWVSLQSKNNNLGIECMEDPCGNILFKRPATSGFESLKSIMLQSHLDMVCVTDLEGGFDFKNDPIPLRITDDKKWVEAIGTSLGGDDGIGVALSVALLVDPEISFGHGELEVLCTVQEENGLIGANLLDVAHLNINSKHIINLDCLFTGGIVIGSAGGGTTTYEKEFQKYDLNNESEYMFIKIFTKGLRSGHSGADIHLPRANAIKIISRILTFINEIIPLNIAIIDGGNQMNVIPSSADVIFGVKSEKFDVLIKMLEEVKKHIYSYYRPSDNSDQNYEPLMEINWNSHKSIKSFSTSDSKSIISLINLLPHGAIEISPENQFSSLNLPSQNSIQGLIELTRLSNNLAKVTTENGKITISSYYRGNIYEELIAFSHSMGQFGYLSDWKTKTSDISQPWRPNKDSSLVDYTRGLYKKHINREPTLLNLHVGLEPSLLGEKIPGAKMVSMGPTVMGVHSTKERIKIVDVGIFYNVLKDILKNIEKLR